MIVQTWKPVRGANMDEQIERALRQDQTIDIITTGRKSGQARRVEIWFHRLGDRLYITGTPGPRAWLANLRQNPEFTFHLKETVQADLPAHARVIDAEPERRRVLAGILQKLDRSADLEEWVQKSPLIEVVLEQGEKGIGER
jgi:deazaflavin-dependent oxidoreductase (nitroreductase family)